MAMVRVQAAHEKGTTRKWPCNETGRGSVGPVVRSKHGAHRGRGKSGGHAILSTARGGAPAGDEDDHGEGAGGVGVGTVGVW